MAPDSIWPGMFQADAGGDNTASVSITMSVNSDMADSYAIYDEQEARKVLDKRQ